MQNNLKEILKKKQVTQKELAKKTKITRAAICRYVNMNRMPTGENMLKISKELNVSVEEIWGI